MSIFTFANNVQTTLAGSISPSSTTITLASSANLPTSIPAGEVLVITLNDVATRLNFEIMYATAIVGATLTVERAQEGTAALSWLVGDYAFSGVTAGQMGQGKGRILSVPLVFTATGSWTVNPNASLWHIFGAGAGAGGAASTTSGSGVCSGTACGQNAAAGEFWFTGLSGTYAIDIGAGGAGGATSGASGTNGGNTTLGSKLILPGGRSWNSTTPSAAPYEATNGGASLAPTVGSGGITVWSVATNGGGGSMSVVSNTFYVPGVGNSAFGTSAQGYGAGGLGAFTGASTGFIAGLAGNGGFLTIEEYS